MTVSEHKWCFLDYENVILNCFIYYEQSDWSKRGILCIYHIIRY